MIVKQVKLILTILLSSTVSISWSSHALAEVKAKYDQFKNKTTITVFGKRVHNRPLLHVWHQSDGQNPDSNQSATVGFLINQACGNPNFLADGKRVQPQSGTDSPTDLHLTTNDFNEDTKNIQGLFGFTFYNLPQVKQIATAKSVQYQLCKQVFTLSPQDQAELRKFLSYFKE